MAMERVLALLLLLLVSLPGRATDYFVCDCGTSADAQCANGDDSKDGKSQANAWRTYDRAQDGFGALAAGDTLQFCRGGVFPVTGSVGWRNRNCRAAQPCTIGAYTPFWASGDEGMPRIVQTQGNAFSFTNGGSPTHEEGYVLRDLDIACTACTINDWGVFLYNDIDDVLLQHLRIHDFAIGVYIGYSNGCDPATPGCDRANDRIVLRDSEISDNFNLGFLGAGDDVVIADNRFLRNGSGTVKEHNIYVSGQPGSTHRIRVLRNLLYRSAAHTTGSCQGAPLSVHGVHEDLLIEGNDISEDLGAVDTTCWGIDLTGGYPNEAEGFTRAIVRGNTIRNVGNAVIAVANCVDCVVENNRIENQQTGSTIGILAPAKTREAVDLALTHLIVRNNSIYLTAPGSVGIRLDTEGTQHAVISNAIQATAATGTFSCLSLDLPVSAYSAVDYNVCGYVAGSGREWEHGSGALPAWRAASSFDLHSVAQNPGFAAPGAPGHDLRAATAIVPMVGAGDPANSAPHEFYGVLRGPAPDAGAHQYGIDDVIFRDGLGG